MHLRTIFVAAVFELLLEVLSSWDRIAKSASVGLSTRVAEFVFASYMNGVAPANPPMRFFAFTFPQTSPFSFPGFSSWNSALPGSLRIDLTAFLASECGMHPEIDIEKDRNRIVVARLRFIYAFLCVTVGRSCGAIRTHFNGIDMPQAQRSLHRRAVPVGRIRRLGGSRRDHGPSH